MMHLSRGRSSRRPIALSVLVGAVVLSACAGENLFQIAAVTVGSGPTVDITAPAEAASITQGAAVQVTADVIASGGLTSAEYSGEYTSGAGTAFVGSSAAFQNQTTAEVSATLNAVAGQTAGEVWLIVKVTDALGEFAADTVKVEIVP